jgi:hypothetical protein
MQCAAYLRVAALYPAFSRARVVWRVRASDRRARRHHRVQAVPLASMRGAPTDRADHQPVSMGRLGSTAHSLSEAS